MRSAYCAASVRSCIAATSVSPDSARSSVEQLERLLLMADVERRSRLVEQDDPRLLRERTCDDDALLLAARERPETPSRVAEQVEPRRARGGGLAIPPPLLRERAEVRRAAEEHVLAHRHPGRRRGLLRDDGEQPRELRPYAAPAVSRPSSSIEPENGDEARDRPQQRRLPRAVRPDERDPLALRDVEIDVVARPAARRAPRSPAGARSHVMPRVVLVERSTSAKNGAPRNAVTTPSGISAGESAVRAITSARTRNPAPAIDGEREQRPVARPGEQANRMRDDDPDEPDQPASPRLPPPFRASPRPRARAGRAERSRRGSPPRRRRG